MQLPDEVSLGEARSRMWVAAEVAKEGTVCPCCSRRVKVYRRRIHYRMAHDLITAYRRARRDWFHMPSTTQYQGGDTCKLVYWGLLEEGRDRRDDGGRAGWWRLTDDGVAYVLGTLRVPMRAVVYNDIVLRLDDAEGRPNIHDALGTHFDYDDLMNGGI